MTLSGRTVGLPVATALTLAALSCLCSCGSSDAPTAGAPVPSPTAPAIEPTTLAFVHVVGDGTVTSYAVAPTTGWLSSVATERLPGACLRAAAAPNGRFLFVNFQVAAAGSSSEPRYLLRSYAIDRTTGALTLARQIIGDYRNFVATPRVLLFSYWSLRSPSKGSDRRLGAVIVDQDGSLMGGHPRREPVYSPFPAGDILFADPKSERFLSSFPYDTSGFAAWDVGAITEWGDVWLGEVFSGGYRDDDKSFSNALVADGVVVLASANGEITSFEPFAGDGHVLEKSSVKGPGPLLAYANGILAAASSDGVVEAFAIAPHGGLAALATTRLGGSVRSLAFHPSGRFLYVSGAAVQPYLVEADGSLRPFGDQLLGAGQVVVTTPSRD